MHLPEATNPTGICGSSVQHTKQDTHMQSHRVYCVHRQITHMGKGNERVRQVSLQHTVAQMMVELHSSPES